MYFSIAWGFNPRFSVIHSKSCEYAFFNNLGLKPQAIEFKTA
jgi:hypothetical protein